MWKIGENHHGHNWYPCTASCWGYIAAMANDTSMHGYWRAVSVQGPVYVWVDTFWLAIQQINFHEQVSMQWHYFLPPRPVGYPYHYKCNEDGLGVLNTALSTPWALDGSELTVQGMEHLVVAGKYSLNHGGLCPSMGLVARPDNPR